MSQSRSRSFSESVANVLVGLLINITAQVIVFPWFGIHITMDKNLGIAACFTVISMARSYSIRRWFNVGNRGKRKKAVLEC